MEKQPASLGTSPEVLQHYLTAGIEVEVIEPYGGAGSRHKLRGIDPRLQFPVLCGDYSTGSEFAYFGILPVLCPFSALTERLADGTVPAIALAQIIFGNALTLNGELWAGIDWFGNVVVTENGVRLFSITKYWHCDTANGLESGFEAYDYLRKNHFAVGLEPHQYIAKEPGSPAIQEGAPAS